MALTLPHVVFSVGTGCGHGFVGMQFVPGPSQFRGGGQSWWVVIVHSPVAGTQHAPTGGWQGFGVQTASVPSHWPAQALCVVIVQVPSGRQQAPTGCTQGLGTHRVPIPSHSPVHSACVVIAQVPSVWQQAPTGWAHGLGVQLDP
jgi:hypothetical protein